MPWVYLDDKFDQHPKVVRAGSAAAWLFVTGLCWVNRNLTDGRIPADALRLLTDQRRPGPLAERLVAVGLWERTEDGYAVHDYGFWNKTAKSMSDKARNAAERRWERERLSNARASAPAMPEHLPEQSPRAHARAGSLSPLPSPVVKDSPSDLSLVETDGGEETIEATPKVNGSGSALVARLASAVLAKGPEVKAEARTVVNLCRQHVADQLIDEAIGYIADLKDKPKRPRYLLSMIPKWAEQRGVHGVPKLELPSPVSA